MEKIFLIVGAISISLIAAIYILSKPKATFNLQNFQQFLRDGQKELKEKAALLVSIGIQKPESLDDFEQKEYHANRVTYLLRSCWRQFLNGLLEVPRELLQECLRTNTQVSSSTSAFIDEFMDTINKICERMQEISKMTPLEEGAILASSKDIGLLAMSTETNVLSNFLSASFFSKYESAFITPLKSSLGATKTRTIVLPLLSSLLGVIDCERALLTLSESLSKEDVEWLGCVQGVSQVEKVGGVLVFSRFQKLLSSVMTDCLLPPSTSKSMKLSDKTVEEVQIEETEVKATERVFASVQKFFPQSTSVKRVSVLSSKALWLRYLSAQGVSSLLSDSGELTTPATRLTDPRSVMDGIFDGDSDKTATPSRSRNETVVAVVNPSENELQRLKKGETTGNIQLRDLKTLTDSFSKGEEIKKVVLLRVQLGLFSEIDDKNLMVGPSQQAARKLGHKVGLDWCAIKATETDRSFIFWSGFARIYPEIEIDF
eukprot:GDKJ01012512.1.p1 GENE.GDKJ01012512.1~~GDKJ01012512.1.p1  ORF type:complete len:499 (-),score=111.81 GDKJ01012512.1:46-1506(-)